MSATNFNSYVQGYIFRDNAESLDGSNFVDQSGYGADLRCDAAPTFGTVSGVQGWQIGTAFAFPSNPYHGTLVVAIHPWEGTGSGCLIAMGQGNSNDKGMWMRFLSPQSRIGLALNQNTYFCDVYVPVDEIAVIAMSWDQENNQFQITQDGITIQTTAEASNNLICQGVNNFIPGVDMKFAAGPRVATIFEAHFFRDNLIANANADLRTWLAEMAVTYGGA